MTPDELKAIPKGHFVVMKTGTHPMQTRLRLFLDWGITFGEAYQTPDRGQRKVYYADRKELEEAILEKYPQKNPAPQPPQAAPRAERFAHPRPPLHRAEDDASSLRP